MTPRPPYYVPDQRRHGEAGWLVLRHQEYEDVTAPVGKHETREKARTAARIANEAWLASQGVA